MSVNKCVHTYIWQCSEAICLWTCMKTACVSTHTSMPICYSAPTSILSEVGDSICVVTQWTRLGFVFLQPQLDGSRGEDSLPVTFRQSVRIWSQSVLLLSSFFCDFVQRCSTKPSTIVSFLPVFKGSLQGHWIPYTGGESGSSNLPVSRSSLSSAHYGFSGPWRHLKYLYPL